MNKADLDGIVRLLHDHVDEVIEDRLKNLRGLIAHEVQRQLHDELSDEVHRAVRAAVKRHVTVEVRMETDAVAS